MQTVRIGAGKDFDDPGKRVVVVDDEEFGVFRIGGEFFAWRNVCPHQGGPVCQGRVYPLVQENIDADMKSYGRIYDEKKVNIVCPWHGLEFDIRTGKHPGTVKLALEPAKVQIEAGEVYVIV